MPGASYTPTARLAVADPPLRQGDPADLDADRVDRDTRAFLRAALPGELVWRDQVEVLPGGAHDDFAVVVGAIAHLVVADGTGELRAISRAEATLGIGDVEGTPGTLGAAAAPWYVYARRTGGALSFEISDTPPDPTLTWKSDGGDVDATRRYLRTFHTDGTGAPIPMLASRGRCLYRRSAVASVTNLFASGGLTAVAGATVVGHTELNLSARLPPHARVGLVSVLTVFTASTADGVGSTNLYSADDTASVALEVQARAEGSAITAATSALTAALPLTDTQRAGYSVTEANGTTAGTIYLAGWEE